MRHSAPVQSKSVRNPSQVRRLLSYANYALTCEGIKHTISVLLQGSKPLKRSYARWIYEHEMGDALSDAGRVASLVRRPLFSIVVPVYNVELRWLNRCIKSVQAQSYSDWQLCVADDCSTKSEIVPALLQYAESDSRIQLKMRDENGGISKATNSAIAMAKGDFIVFMDNDDEMAPNALLELAETINGCQDIDFIYTDEDKIDESGQRFDPFFKPGYSPYLLLGHNYITHLVSVSRALLNRTGELRPEFDGSQDYDFVLRAVEKAQRIVHIPKILYHWRTLQTSVARNPSSKLYAFDAGLKAVRAAVERRGIHADVAARSLGTQKLVFKADVLPEVYVVVKGLSSQEVQVIRSMTNYPKFSLSSVVPEITCETQQSACLIFLDRVIPVNPDWIENMVGYLSDPAVGLVGGIITDSRERILDGGLVQPDELRGPGVRGQWARGRGHYFRTSLPREAESVSSRCVALRADQWKGLYAEGQSTVDASSESAVCAYIKEVLGKSIIWDPDSEFRAIRRGI